MGSNTVDNNIYVSSRVTREVTACTMILQGLFGHKIIGSPLSTFPTITNVSNEPVPQTMLSGRLPPDPKWGLRLTGFSEKLEFHMLEGVNSLRRNLYGTTRIWNGGRNSLKVDKPLSVFPVTISLPH